MTGRLRDALDRTLLLMRDDVVASDPILLRALMGTSIALVADLDTLASHSGQTAFVTAALLMARSAHTVHLLAPDAYLLGTQPPLKPGRIVTSLLEAGADLLPGIVFHAEEPHDIVDLEVRIGAARPRVSARSNIVVTADSWAARILSRRTAPAWPSRSWPFGGMACGALVAGEAFKRAMWKLEPYAKNPTYFSEFFAATEEVDFRLAADGTNLPNNLEHFDIVSGRRIRSGMSKAEAKFSASCSTRLALEPFGCSVSACGGGICSHVSKWKHSCARP